MAIWGFFLLSSVLNKKGKVKVILYKGFYHNLFWNAAAKIIMILQVFFLVTLYQLKRNSPCLFSIGEDI